MKSQTPKENNASVPFKAMPDAAAKNNNQEARGRVVLLSMTLCFIIGGYWLLRVMKVPVLRALVGLKYQPMAKIYSLFVMVIVLFIYNFILDRVPRHKLFYIVGGFYSIVFFLITYALTHPIAGLPNKDVGPHRWLGWLSFFAIESYGSLAVSMFWSFVNSVYTIEGAKKNYGHIIAGSQLGAIAGPVIVNFVEFFGGLPVVYGIGAALPAMCTVTFFFYMKLYGHGDIAKKAAATVVDEAKPKKKKTGVLEGLRLFAAYPYVFGIFAISCLFEITITILDYEMLTLAGEVYKTNVQFTSFMGKFGTLVNTVAFFISLGITKMIFKKFRLRHILMAFPSLVCSTVVFCYFFPTLWFVFSGLVFLKALTYAVNNPAKEMLYSVTTMDVKFKSKSWIDAFGSRAAKAAGSAITGSFNKSMELLFGYGSLVSVGVSVILVFVASIMGAKCESHQASGFKVGEEKKVASEEV